MKYLFATAALLSLGVLVTLGHAHHGHEAVSYSVVTKHEDHEHGHEHGHDHHDHHELDHHGHGHEEHHENYISHGHQEHHGHEAHHGHAEHNSHEKHHSQGGHQVEHHGNNGDDDDHHGHHDEHNSHAKYEFKYGVKDPKTGDVKQQWESRDGHAVKGSYSLKEADGTTRVVNYSSDKKKGFEATVHKIGHAHHGHQEHHLGNH